MQELVTALPALSGLIEKGGIIGVLLIACGVLVWEIRRGRRREHEFRNEMAKVYGQRDKWRIAFVKCKAALDAAGVKVDLSDLQELIGGGET